MRYTLKHSAKGTTWSDHKYIRKEGNRYIYPTDKTSNNNLYPGINAGERYGAVKEQEEEKANEDYVTKYLEAEDAARNDPEEQAYRQRAEELMRKKETEGLTEAEERLLDTLNTTAYERILDKRYEKGKELKAMKYDENGNLRKEFSKYGTADSDYIKKKRQEETSKRQTEKYKKAISNMPSSDKAKIKEQKEGELANKVPASVYKKITGKPSVNRLYDTSKELRTEQYMRDAQKAADEYAEKKRKEKEREKDWEVVKGFFKNMGEDIVENHKRNFKNVKSRFLKHSGKSKMNGAKVGSGRYPLGSGNRPYQMLEGKSSEERDARIKKLINRGDIKTAYNNRRDLQYNELENVLKRYDLEKKYKKAIKELDDKKRKDIIKFILNRSEDIETANKALKAINGLVDNLEKFLPKD